MRDPKHTPPPWTTSHGVKASARMARLYSWINDNKIFIRDFSTDASVDQYAVQLTDLLSDLKKAMVSGKVADLTPDEAEALRVDLETLMRRGTGARVKATRVGR